MSKAKRGRPTAFKPEFIHIAKQMCLMGATDKDLAAAFKVTEQTINNWKESEPEFFESLKAGKEFADTRVVQSLYARANGYSHPSEKIFTTKDGDVIRADTIEHYPPDATSMIFWLKNRLPDQWRDKNTTEHELGKETLESLLTGSWNSERQP